MDKFEYKCVVCGAEAGAPCTNAKGDPVEPHHYRGSDWKPILPVKP